jgi:hypothetical protein
MLLAIVSSSLFRPKDMAKRPLQVARHDKYLKSWLRCDLPVTVPATKIQKTKTDTQTYSAIVRFFTLL